MIDSKAGIEHLLQKLRATGEIHAAVTLTDETMPDVLFECQEALVSIIDRLRGRTLTSMGSGSGAGASGAGGAMPGDLEEENPFNRRITLPGERDEDDVDAEEEDAPRRSGSAGGVDAVARQRVKAASRALVQNQERADRLLSKGARRKAKR